MTPNTLAEKLAGASARQHVGKTFVRPLLREFFPRDARAKNTSWFLTDEQVALVTHAWKAKQKGESARAAALAHRDAKRKRAARKPAASVTDES